jgi:DNA-directed RNA polymerase
MSKVIDGMTCFSGQDYIRINIANCMGKDKVVWEERLDWVKSNEHQLDSFVEEADEPYQYIKSVLALDEAKAGRSTGLPVGLDATASGVQMFACISGCVKTASAVNLVNDGKRHDLYTEMFKKMGFKNTMELLGKLIARADVKDAIMTHFYSSVRSPQELFTHKLSGEIIEMMLAKFYHVLNIELPGASLVMNAYELAQDHLFKTNTPVYGIEAPDGFEVINQMYVKNKFDVECNTELGLKWKFSYQEDVAAFNEKDKSVPANMAHLLDSWVAREMVIRAHRIGFDIYHVHDKYFSSPNHMNKTRMLYREILADLCTSGWLRKSMLALCGIDVGLSDNSELRELILNSDYGLC